MVTETQDMEPRQLASRGPVALQCGQQYLLQCLLRSPHTEHVCEEELSLRGRARFARITSQALFSVLLSVVGFLALTP
jgi:hypothetical protein